MTPHRRLLVACLLALPAAFACAPRAAAVAPPPAAAPAPGWLDLSAVDRATAPGDDFYAFANGAWLKSTGIPPDRSVWGSSAQMVDLTQRRVADLVAEAERAQAPAGTELRKIGDTYASFLDEAAIEALGAAPLKPALDRAAAIADKQALARALGATLRADVDVLNNTWLHTPNLLGLWVAADLDDPTRYAPFLLQGGLALPDREYYLSPSPRMAEVRGKYQAHVAALLALAGVAGAEAKAARILDLETRMAAVHASREATGDVQKGNNHWARADFAARAPGLDWGAFFEAAGLGTEQRFVVWQPGAVSGLSALVASQPLEAWKEWLAFHELERAAAFLPRAFVDEQFAFHGKVLTGAPQQRDRWKRAVDVTDAALGEAVGRLYVERFFPPAEKARAEEMVRNIMAAFARRIDALDWMAPATKAQAKAKLAVLKVGVGYPDKWRDTSGLQVVRGDALGNAERAARFHTREAIARLGQPVDRGEWVMNPQLVNAVNLPALNAMNFPAAILQPPEFDPARPVVMDYGAIGAVIGHEISHSFDDQGALFDADGRLRNWWTEADFAHFRASGAALARQYDAYRPFPDLAINGTQTLGENIADLAGLAAAFDAYRMAYGGRPAPPAEGLSGDQQFFLSYAWSWRQKYRDPVLRQRVITDGHSPAPWRVATVRNLDAWVEAFGVREGQGLFLPPDRRVRVW